MNPNGGGGGPPPPPPIPPIDPLVKPRGLPILVPQNLVATDMPTNLLKFYGTRDDGPSRHMKRYVERMIFSLITDHGYWLVWFPTIMDGEAYEWYRDHEEGHFRTWCGNTQTQKDPINGFKCLIRIFPGDLSVVQRFYEV